MRPRKPAIPIFRRNTWRRRGKLQAGRGSIHSRRSSILKPADTSTTEQKNFEYAQTHPGFPQPGAAKATWNCGKSGKIVRRQANGDLQPADRRDQTLRASRRSDIRRRGLRHEPAAGYAEADAGPGDKTPAVPCRLIASAARPSRSGYSRHGNSIMQRAPRGCRQDNCGRGAQLAACDHSSA